MKEAIEYACERYIDILNSPANANGQHQDANGTPSHAILAGLYSRYGKEEVQSTLRSLFAKVS